MDNDTTVFVGLDVHKDSITVARVGSIATDPVVDVGNIGTRQYAIDRMLAKLAPVSDLTRCHVSFEVQYGVKPTVDAGKCRHFTNRQ